MNLPEHDVIYAFDNNQVLQRRWKVKLKNEVKCNIVTVIVFFSISKDGRLQHQSLLKPTQWASRNLTDDEIQHIKYSDLQDDVKTCHYELHLYPFLQKEIQAVVAEQIESNVGDCIDVIDQNVIKQRREELYKKCYQCNFDEIPKAKHTCPMCKANVTKTKMKSMGITENGTIEESIHSTCPVEYKGGSRSPAVACWASDHWVASSNPLRGKFRN